MTPYENIGCVKLLLFDSFPIENYICSLLHAKIDVGDKIIYSYFEWIIEITKPIREKEVNMTNFKINLKIKQNNYQKQYDEWINNKSYSLAELRLERQSIQSFFERTR